MSYRAPPGDASARIAVLEAEIERLQREAREQLEVERLLRQQDGLRARAELQAMQASHEARFEAELRVLRQRAEGDVAVAHAERDLAIAERRRLQAELDRCRARIAELESLLAGRS